MTAEAGLIDRIYEAGAVPEMWPSLFQDLGERFGAKGGLIMSGTGPETRWVASPTVHGLVERFVAEGWADRNSRASRIFAAPPHAGFRTDMHTPEEMRTLPLFVEFLNPHGIQQGVATIVQGVGDDAVMLTLEGFPDARAAADAIAPLDRLRPHLARAAVLSARFQLERLKAAVLALDLIGTPAVMLDAHGHARAMNAGFERLLGADATDTPRGLRLRDPGADAMLHRALAEMGRGGRSIPFRRMSTLAPAALHLIPMRGAARDFFSGVTAIGVVAEASNRAVPGADLLQLLFDLTPAEAHVARAVVAGHAPAAIAQSRHTSVETVRTQLKSIMGKTAADSQAGLRVLLTTLAKAERADAEAPCGLIVAHAGGDQDGCGRADARVDAGPPGPAVRSGSADRR